VQGPENALCLDGGRTLGWEVVDQAAALGDFGRRDRVYVQVGGGAFAACVGRAMGDALGRRAPMRVVQAAGCAPLERAWRRAGEDLERGVAHLGRHWSELMTPWSDPRSLADGILDDETYDWLGIVDALQPPWGSVPVVAAEADVVAAHRLAVAAGFDVSPTGSAGLAGVLAEIDDIDPAERVVVFMSGVRR
jgi:threonine synthase